jgi:hypothetical protein
MKTNHLSIANIFIASLILIATSLLQACSSDEPTPDPEPSRTVIVYMAANNNLGSQRYDRLDLDEMRSAASQIPDNSHLVVYHAARHKDPALIEITKDGDVTLKTYDGGYSDGLTLTPSRMKEVFSDVESLAKADSYALVLWSHGTGWVETSDSRSASPLAEAPAATPMPLSFGDDGGTEMKITSLAQALEGRRFDFIYFDCCLMGSIEVAYELKDAAPVIVASPTELQVYGMPYQMNVPEFFATEPDMVKAATNTFTYYANGVNGMSPYCTMSVVETAHLKELADATVAIMRTGALAGPEYTPVRFYGFYRNSFVDMAHYISSLPDVDPALVSAWKAAYDKAVVYKAATPTYGKYDLTGFGGLSCAMLSAPSDASYMGYDNHAWYRDVVSLNPSLTPAAY